MAYYEPSHDHLSSFQKNSISMRGVCGPQKGVNLGQNERFLPILKERKHTIDFKTWITDLMAYYQPSLDHIGSFQNYWSHCGGSVGPKMMSIWVKISVFHTFWTKGSYQSILDLNNWTWDILLTLPHLSRQFSKILTHFMTSQIPNFTQNGPKFA